MFWKTQSMWDDCQFQIVYVAIFLVLLWTLNGYITPIVVIIDSRMVTIFWTYSMNNIFKAHVFVIVGSHTTPNHTTLK